jgi:hypothetical protein
MMSPERQSEREDPPHAGSATPTSNVIAAIF